MNQTITSRNELLLAKIAGHEVDLKTMTPGVASNLTEQFLLEIADRLDHMGGGGGGDERFVVTATITGEDSFTADKSAKECFDAYNEGKEVVLQTGESGYIVEAPLFIGFSDDSGDSERYVVQFASMQCMEAERPSFIFLTLEDDDGSYFDVDWPDQSAELNVIHAGANDVPEATSMMLNINESVSEIREYFQSGKPIAIDVAWGGLPGGGVRKLRMFGNLASMTTEPGDNDESVTHYMLTFSALDETTGYPVYAVISIYGDNIIARMQKLDYKKPETFDFAATSDGQGGFVVVPGVGSTYAAIYAAMQRSPNVYANVLIDESITLIAPFNGITSTEPVSVSASGVGVIGGGWTGLLLNVTTDGATAYTRAL